MVDGIFNVLKPPGMTSHDVVSSMRHILNQKKVGHGGTLDPMAAGVLPVFAGKATRFLEYAVEGNKVYRARITFGAKTDTGDAEGKVIATSPVLNLEKAEVEKALASFLGAGKQVPPMYSAISVGGQKLYKMARAGIEIEREARDIFIPRIDLLYYNQDELMIEVECSKGTFIRTLSEDIAEKLGMVGTMTTLLRRQVGNFTLETSGTLEEIRENPEKFTLPMEMALADFPELVVNNLQGRRIAQGVATTVKNIQEGTTYKLVAEDNLVVGLAQAKDGKLKGTKIINVPVVKSKIKHEDN